MRRKLFMLFSIFRGLIQQHPVTIGIIGIPLSGALVILTFSKQFVQRPNNGGQKTRSISQRCPAILAVFGIRIMTLRAAPPAGLG